ncbi:hypothetical protein NDU88_008281 [Pleurodeles waltl]|uniref:Uncharacterized protein n=1 Tax=Pleurodeles waltl TaxID=8319 RepID=A0AAV7QP96_PLEWA|nr:hypothetical protein NDU88_008281 [Pleurodeles waltl]
MSTRIWKRGGIKRRELHGERKLRRTCRDEDPKELRGDGELGEKPREEEESQEAGQHKEDGRRCFHRKEGPSSSIQQDRELSGKGRGEEDTVERNPGTRHFPGGTWLYQALSHTEDQRKTWKENKRGVKVNDSYQKLLERKTRL